ncbi:RagB/SusD family nutrient uptake outer membrane protein [Rudanella paleaurantiibacter]|uniref:RagB/SusD family nutrient uptake outer membrane protein n=1 Tax=Rudanella paleaurantiibacter TaxID=2614655 RepID=A0A7J5U0Q0_9BACT|nr:RagB/SusD family nutrient uptake outer membrane protein [Rudanella paleaurantiibacter]KAB7731270.1 RagB/SusD family nutrient uptake outer membrane protein [Rudanella paleaurantiibacter]
MLFSDKYIVSRRGMLRTALVTAVLGTSLTACDQETFLNPTPLTSLADVEAFSTPDRVLAQVNGLYASVKSGQFMGGRYQVYVDVRGEEFLNVTNNGVTALSAWNHTQNSGSNEPTNLWNAAYLAINRANLFLAGLDANPTVIDQTLANQYRGEARLLRALTYHQMVQLFAQPYTKDNGASPGLPLRIKGEVGSGGNDLARATVAEVYKQILDDLNFAEQNLPANYASATLNTTRAHKNTAIALKTRVYLAMGQWANVVTEANKIVSTAAPYRASTGVAHQLQADVRTVFSNYTTTESIFSMPFSSNDLPGTQNGLHSYYVPLTGIGDYSLNPNGIISNTTAFATADARRNFVKSDFSGDLISGAQRNRLFKFPTGPVHTDWAPVIRYSEVLLNAAEARARLNTSAVDEQGLALLNAVRTRSNPTGAYTAAGLANSAGLVSAILTERRIEFLGEGMRSNDLLRTNQPLPEKGGVQSAPRIQAVPTTASVYIWPLPQTELNVNKLAVQNP